MRAHLAPKLAFIALVALGAFVAGCTSASPYMHPRAAPSITGATVDPAAVPRFVAPADAAVVVFVRPSDYARTDKLPIIDEHGRFLGVSTIESYFAVAMPPGQHAFVTWDTNHAALTATLACGRVYYVEVAVYPGFWGTKAQLLAITPRAESWTRVAEWLASADGYDPDPVAGQQWLDQESIPATERVQTALDAYEDLDKEDFQARVLYPQDGR